MAMHSHNRLVHLLIGVHRSAQCWCKKGKRGTSKSLLISKANNNLISTIPCSFLFRSSYLKNFCLKFHIRTHLMHCQWSIEQRRTCVSKRTRCLRRTKNEEVASENNCNNINTSPFVNAFLTVCSRTALAPMVSSYEGNTII